MGVSTGYDFGIRSGLAGKGVEPSQIGYDPGRGYVTVGGKDFMKADKTFNGSSFTNQQKFDAAWGNYNRPVNTGYAVPGIGGVAGVIPAGSFQKPQTQPQTQPSPQATPQQAVDPMAAYNQHLQAIDALMKQPVDANAIYASPEYAAYQAKSARDAQGATRAAQEAYGSAGFGRSYALGERAQGIQNDAVEYMNSQVLPQLMAQARADQQQKIQNEYGLVDRAWNQVNRGDDLAQNAESNAINKGTLTGTYQSPEMKGLYDEVLQAKQAYAFAKTPEERAAAHQRGETARDKLKQLNANADLVGSNVTYDQATGNAGNFGVQTMDAKRMTYDQSKDNPANQAQIISNKIDSLKLQHLPEQMQLELDQLKQQVATGKIDAKTAEYNLNELTNPNSITNQRNKLQLQLDQMNVSNTSTQNKLEVQKLQKQIAQIGKVQPKSDYDAKMDQIKLDTAKAKLENLQKGGSSGSAPKAGDYKTNPDFASDIAYIQSTPNALDEIQSNSEELINEYGYDGYQALLSAAGG